MKDNSKTNTLLLTVIGVATLLVAVIGATFAYFTAQISGGETTPTVKMNAGTLKINFANGTEVELVDGFLPTAAKVECDDKKPSDGTGYYCDQAQYEPVGVKKFTLTGSNTTNPDDNMKMPYTINLVVTKNGFTDGAIKYTLVGTKTAGGNAADGELVQIPQWVDVKSGAQDAIKLGTGYFLPGDGIVHSYELNIYFPDNHIVQDDDKYKAFGAKVEIGTEKIEQQA